jgi:hypothetical protein
MWILALLGILFALFLAGKCQRALDEWLRAGADEYKIEMRRLRLEHMDRERRKEDRHG